VRHVELVAGVCTSALGFGTAGFGARLGERERRRLLDAAYDAGIRHLDTAPIYGDGSAERTVGRFLAERRGDVTVAAKIGLLPARAGRAAALVRRLPGISADARRSTPPEAQAGFERTLRNLRSDHVDVLLLHECVAADPLLDEWRGLLEDAVSSGRARATGIATSPEETKRVLTAAAPGDPFPAVVQVAADTVVVPPERGAVFHSVLARAGDRSAAPELLAAALASHPRAVALFFSSRPERVAANATVAA
jgi:aryl-alcohol dehydrogenase-like predicted oxidoreductase